MIRLDLSYFYRLGTSVAQIRYMATDVPQSQVLPTLNNLRPWLEQLRNDRTLGLRGARAHIDGLLTMLTALSWPQTEERVFSFNDYWNLITAVNNFEVVLLSELAIADAYYVLEKKPYSTAALVTEGEHLFPSGLEKKVPEALGDLREAGKCLAFEVPTAAAFHIHRATEAVLRRYWHVVTGNPAKPKQRSIGVYLAAMKKLNCGDEKVIAALTQMKDLHRNVIIHPEESLDINEAIGLLGIANSVVAAMLKEIPDNEPEQPEIQFPPLIDAANPPNLIDVDG